MEVKKSSSPKKKFTEEEDERLLSTVKMFGNKDWNLISSKMKTRNPRQCKERWNNYINPELRKDAWTVEEDLLLEKKICEIGKKWKKIGLLFKGRSDNSIRNRWMVISRYRPTQEKNKGNALSDDLDRILFNQPALFPDDESFMFQ